MNLLKALIVANIELGRRIISLEVQGDIDNQKGTIKKLEELKEAANKLEDLIALCKD